MKTKLLIAALCCSLYTNVSAYTKVDQLFNAITSQNISMVQALVSGGIDPNMDVALYNTTPLMHAVETSTVEMVENLIKYGSNVDVADSSGTTPLIYSIKTNKQDIASVLIKKSRNINMKDQHGRSAIHYAAKKGNENIFKQVVAAGGDLKLVDKSGENALFHALAGRNKRIINSLIESKQIDLAQINNKGETAVKVAMKQGMDDVAERISRGRN